MVAEHHNKSRTIPEAPGACWISSRFFHQRVLPIQQKARGRLQAAQTAVSLGSRACTLLFAEEELPQREGQLFHAQGIANKPSHHVCRHNPVFNSGILPSVLRRQSQRYRQKSGTYTLCSES